MKWGLTIALAAAAVGLCSAIDPCPDPFINLSTDPVTPKCLAFMISSGTWHSMLSVCEMIPDSSLAQITGDLHNSVYQYILNHPDWMDKCFWIGGTDEVMEDHWVWVNDKSEIPLGSPHWDPCEPEPDGGTKENYLAICPEMYYFKDYPEDRFHHAICQKFI